VVPDQPVALGALTRRLADRKLVEKVSLVIASVVDVPPSDLSQHHSGAEGGIFTSGAGKHAEEPAAMLVDVGHVLGSGQLAIRDVEEVVSPGQLAEQVPGGDMGPVVGGVATLNPEVHRHGTVAADGEDVEQLLEVGAVILVVAPGDREAELSPQRALPVGVLVVAVECHGSGVVVQLVERDVKRVDGVGRDVQYQSRDVGVEEAIQRTADAIIVERGELLVGQVEPVCVVPRGPLADAVEGLARDEQVPHEQEQGRGRGDSGPPILSRQVFAKEFLDAKPSDEAIENRQSAHAPRLEGASLGVCRFPRPSCLLVLIHVSRSRRILPRTVSRPSPGFRGPKLEVAWPQRSPPT
jgi:hypothetical protein